MELNSLCVTTAHDKAILTALASIEGITSATFRRLFAYLRKTEATLGEIWARDQGLLLQNTLTEKQIDGTKSFKKEYTLETYQEWLVSHSIRPLTFWDDEYPPLLKNCDDCPIVLFAKGTDLHQLLKPIAVVGTRQMTSYGQLATEKIVKELVLAGADIVSGFMFGIDTYAQQQTIAAGGYTVGVLGYGFDRCYPSSHQRLLEAMLAQGATFISEYPPWTGSHKWQFPERNRIVAGMSLATVVIEAGLSSGSHITAEWAVEYGREVFAVPGPLTNPYSEGTKYLINQGARLATTAEDILGEIRLQLGEGAGQEQLLLQTELERRIYRELKNQPLDADELCQILQVPMAELGATLTQLELRQLITQTGMTWRVYG